MNKYDVTLTAHYEKTVSVYADTPEQAKEKSKPSFLILISSSSLTRILSAEMLPSLPLMKKSPTRTSVPTRTAVLRMMTARTARTSVPYVESVCVRTSAKIDMSYQALNLVIHPATDTKFACQGDAPETPL